MHKHIVITVIGPDRVGIVDGVTKKVLEFHGNVEESRMARLGGEFVMLLLISVPGEQAEGLSSAFADIERDGFQLFIRETESTTSTKYRGWIPYKITVSGADNEGIINSVTHYLSEKGVSIESMDTNTTAAPMSGTLLFTMTAIIIVPPELTYHSWREPLNEVSDAMNVGIEVSPYRG